MRPAILSSPSCAPPGSGHGVPPRWCSLELPGPNSGREDFQNSVGAYVRQELQPKFRRETVGFLYPSFRELLWDGCDLPARNSPHFAARTEPRKRLSRCNCTAGDLTTRVYRVLRCRGYFDLA